MIPECLPDRVLVCLRDFFASSGHGEMRRAFEALHGAGAFLSLREHTGTGMGTPRPDGQEQNWRKLEYQFNRLFVGPNVVVAPPYASLYLEAEPRLFGQTTFEVRNFYAEHGFMVPGNSSVPDDYLPYELDAALALRHLLRKNGGERVQARYTWFVCEHLGTWLPLFILQARTATEKLEVPLQECLSLLELWQEREAALCALFV